jgi:hypothetical protein
MEQDPSRLTDRRSGPKDELPEVQFKNRESKRGPFSKKSETGCTVLPDNVPHLVLGLFPIVFICEKPRKIGNQLCAQWVVGQVRLQLL